MSSVTLSNKNKPIRLHDGELNVMELLWANGKLPAKDIANVIKEYVGWEKNTTYTVIKRLIDKGAVKRTDPGFVCESLISKDTVRQIEGDALINQLFEGSVADFIRYYIGEKDLKTEDLVEIQNILYSYSENGRE